MNSSSPTGSGSLSANAVRERFKRVDPADYPELAGLSRDEIYEGKMGPGGLYLAARMIRGIAPSPGMRVMDLGSGRGATSVFLSRRLNAIVHSVDLWITAEERQSLVERHAMQDRVTPLHLDVTKPLPFASGYFDLIFCMDAFHYFGARPGVLARLAKCIRPGGVLVVGNPCFNQEVHLPVPQPYIGPWNAEFSKYHSPAWWSRRVLRTGLFEKVEVREAEDGQALWDDDLLYNVDQGHDPDEIASDAEQIVFGRDHPDRPCLTHYILTATKATKPA